VALAHCDTLFRRFLSGWYSEEDRTRRCYEATRPDIEQLTARPELKASDISPLTRKSQVDTARQVRKILEAATDDWKALLGVQGTPGIDWIDALDQHFKSARILQVIKHSDPRRFDNEYLVLCCELGAVLGATLLALEPQLSWLYDWPYWESALYDQRTRSRINVFHWAVKKMSAYGVDDGLTGKLQACRRLLHEP
jgi:hypothetical protein